MKNNQGRMDISTIAVIISLIALAIAIIEKFI